MSKPNLSQIMEAAQKMQQSMKQTQQELGKLEMTGESGAGLVKIRMNGLRQVLKVDLDPGILSESLEVMQALIATAFNDALKRIEKSTEEKMMDIAKGFSLPDTFTSDDQDKEK